MVFPNNAVILTSEPLEGLSTDDVRQWLANNDTEHGLATALAQVQNQTGWLGHDLDELNEPELSKAEAVYYKWRDLDDELYKKAIAILQGENALGKANHDLSVIGLFNIIKPFMERNGYCDGAGWWVKK